jgi:hypothetical protein
MNWKYHEVLTANFPDKSWSMTGGDYSGLDWQDDDPKPTESELDTIYNTWSSQAEKNKRLWVTEMKATDSSMTRQVEDLWDAIGLDDATQHTKDVHAAKKAVRASKP